MVANNPTVRADLIQLCADYRQAVRLCKALGRGGMTNRTIAEGAGLYPSHASEYFAESPVSKKGIPHRNLPADKIHSTESFLGNHAITQWLAHRANLTVLEEIQLDRAA